MTAYLHRSAKHAAVQILGGALHLRVKVANAPQSVCDARLVGAHPVVVRNAHIIGALQKGVLARNQQLVQSLTSALLHALEHKLEVDGHWNLELLVRLDCVDPAQHGSLVVGRATTKQFAIDFGQHEWVRVPAVLDESRLHVQMAVQAHGLFGGVLGRERKKNTTINEYKDLQRYGVYQIVP